MQQRGYRDLVIGFRKASQFKVDQSCRLYERVTVYLLLTGDRLRLTLRLAALRGDLDLLLEYDRSLHLHNRC